MDAMDNMIAEYLRIGMLIGAIVRTRPAFPC
jgi:hypothetical protein